MCHSKIKRLFLGVYVSMVPVIASVCLPIEDLIFAALEIRIDALAVSVYKVRGVITNSFGGHYTCQSSSIVLERIDNETPSSC